MTLLFEYAANEFPWQNGHTIGKVDLLNTTHHKHVCHVPTQEMNCSTSKSPLGPSSCISINNGSVHISFNESPLLTFNHFGLYLYRNEKAHCGRYLRNQPATRVFLELPI